MFRFFAFAATVAAVFATPARADWHEASTDHFVVYSDDSVANIKRLATRLESFDKAMRLLRGTPDTVVGKANRVTVYVLPSSGQVAKLAGEKYVAGFYTSRAGGHAAFVPRYGGTSAFDLSAQAVLQHEYTHHHMFDTWPNAAFPTWLIEGFAEFHATARLERNGDMTIGAAPLYRGYGLLSGNPLPIDRLLTLTNTKLNDVQRDALYGRGWLLVHYLMFDTARKDQLSAYIRAINEGRSIADAATVFGDMKTLGDDLERYLKKRKILAVVFPAARVAVGEVKVRALSAGEAATMPVRIRSKRGVDAKEAKLVVVEARKRALPFPNDAAAQIVLAEAEYDAGNLDAAEAAADRAIAVDAKSVDALLYKGMARVARTAKAGKTDEASWKEARSFLVKANRADPDDPEPLVAFYTSFAAAGMPATPNAVIGLNRAFALAPQDSSLRMMTAQQYLVDGKSPNARATLRPIAYNPHGGAVAEFATRQIALLDKGDTAAALAEWSKQPDEDGDEPE